MFSKQLFVFTFLLLQAFAAPFPLLTVSKVASPVPGRYIITLKDGISCSAHVNLIRSNIMSTSSKVIHEFSIINGYAGKFSDDDLDKLRSHSDIASIEEDGISHTFDTVIQCVVPFIRGS